MKNTNNYKGIVPLILFAGVFGALIWFIDLRKNEDEPFARDVAGDVEQARENREYVNVELSQLNEFLTVLKNRSEFQIVQNARYDAEVNKIIIGFDGKLSNDAKSLLFGSDKDLNRWDAYYPKSANALYFDHAPNDSTIVKCPAFILAKIVEAYEQVIKQQ